MEGREGQDSRTRRDESVTKLPINRVGLVNSFLLLNYTNPFCKKKHFPAVIDHYVNCCNESPCLLPRRVSTSCLLLFVAEEENILI